MLIRTLTLLCLHLCPAIAHADVVVTNYSIVLPQELLNGRDSAVFILHHGRHFRRFKMMNGEARRMKIRYYLPCRSGINSRKSFDEEILKHNGTVYNLYDVSVNQLITLPSVASDIYGRGIKRDSVYQLTMQNIPIPPDEQLQFFDHLKHHNGRIRLFGSARLSSLLKKNNFSDYFSELMRQIEFKDFTVAELNGMLALGLPETGEASVTRWYNGMRFATYHFRTSAGRIEEWSDSPFSP